MLILKDVTIQDLQARVFVQNVSFTLLKDDRIAIIGEEGNGKSTFMKWIYDENSVKSYTKTTGQCNKTGHHCGYLPQSLPQEWLSQSFFDFLLKDKADEDISPERYNDMKRIEEICAKLQVSMSLLYDNESMQVMSGGERIKAQLVKLLYHAPDILLLDEPTNDLDLETLAWLEDFLLHCQLPLLFISHDEVLLQRVATGILHFEQLQKKTVAFHRFERLPYDDYIGKRKHVISRQNSIASKEKQEHDNQMDRWRQIYQKVDHRLATNTRQDPHTGYLLKKKMRSVQAMKKRLDKEELTVKIEPEEAVNLFFDDFIPFADTKRLLQFHIDCLRVENRVLSQAIDLSVYGQDKIVITGRNGCGKTTLFKQIHQVLQTQKELIIGYMPQQYEDILPQELTALAFLCPTRLREHLTAAGQHLGSAKFTEEEMHMPIRLLSGGQKAKVLLIHFILQKCNVLLLDEPTRNLSPLTGPVIRRQLIDFQGAIIAISHDRLFIAEVCDKQYVLDTQGLHLVE